MKVASFNVNSIRARLNIVIDWLRKEAPDVLCLQETKVTDEEFPRAAFSELQYSAVYHGEKSYNGVAILSKTPPAHLKIGFDENSSGGTRLITATINNIPIVNTYIPQGFHPLSVKFIEKLDWFRKLYGFFNDNFSPERPLLWVGDFNVAPDPIDVYDPVKLQGEIGYHPDERAALQKFREWGFVDVFRRHQPAAHNYTFYDYRIRNAIQRNIGWRVDHIWATAPLADRSQNAWIDMAPRLREKPSDHTIIAAEFEM